MEKGHRSTLINAVNRNLEGTELPEMPLLYYEVIRATSVEVPVLEYTTRNRLLRMAAADPSILVSPDGSDLLTQTLTHFLNDRPSGMYVLFWPIKYMDTMKKSASSAKYLPK